MSWDDWYWEDWNRYWEDKSRQDWDDWNDWWHDDMRRLHDDMRRLHDDLYWSSQHNSINDPLNPLSPNYMFKDNYTTGEGEGPESVIGAIIVLLIFGFLLWIAWEHVKLLESWGFIVKEIARLFGFK